MTETGRNTAEVKPGNQTSEYGLAQKAGIWGVVGLILGFVVQIGPSIMDQVFGTDTQSIGYIIAGCIMQVASIAYKLFVDLGYIKSRTDVKAAATFGTK